MKVVLQVPRRFSFTRTVLSHGWYSLPPYALDKRAEWLAVAVPLDPGRAYRIRLEPFADGVALTAAGRPAAAIRARLVAAAREILSLDLDLEPFYARALEDQRLHWIASSGSGRLLRSSTLFEDLAKLVLTTNCSWAFTRRMVTGLVERLGVAADDGSRAFPPASVIANAGPSVLRDRFRLGYRAPLLHRLALQVADGACDLTDRTRSDLDVADCRARLMELPGVGPYVAENLMRMLGRPCGLALDSWIRAKYARIYHGGRPIRDRTIARRYARMGEWAGLALWCDMTRDWFDGNHPVPALLD